MPIINRKEFEEKLEMLSAEVMVEVIDIFNEGYPERKHNIQEALSENDPKKLEFEIHALKNDLSQFGAEELFNKTQSLLEKIMDKSSADFEKEANKLLDQIDKMLLPELKAWCEKQD